MNYPASHRFTRRLVCHAMLVLASTVRSASLPAAEMRIWADDSGAIEFRAEFVKREGDWVLIRREDGGTGKVPFKWLSDKDQTYVATAASNSAAATEDLRNTAERVRPNTERPAIVGRESILPPRANPESVALPPRGRGDAAVDAFIAYDIGKLGGAEGVQAREQFDRLGAESIGPLIRGLNEAARIGDSCPVVVLRSKLDSCLRQANSPEMTEMAAANLCAGVPKTAPHYRSVESLRNEIITRLDPEHPIRRYHDRVRALMESSNESQIDVSLASDSVSERHAAVTASCAMGPRFGRQLIRAIADVDPAIRQEAREGLRGLAAGVDFGPDEPAAPEQRATASRKWEEWYRQQVQLQTPVAMWRASRTQLRKFLRNDDEATRFGAVAVIHYRGYQMAEDLIKMLADTSQPVRREAHMALVDLADGQDYGPADENDLQPACGRWQLWEDRRRRRFNNSLKTDAQIRQSLSSSDDEERLAAVTTAAIRRLPAAEELCECLSYNMPEVREAAKHGLIQLADGRDYGPADDANEDQRRLAVARWQAWASEFKPPVKPTPESPPKLHNGGKPQTPRSVGPPRLRP